MPCPAFYLSKLFSAVCSSFPCPVFHSFISYSFHCLSSLGTALYFSCPFSAFYYPYSAPYSSLPYPTFYTITSCPAFYASTSSPASCASSYRSLFVQPSMHLSSGHPSNIASLVQSSSHPQTPSIQPSSLPSSVQPCIHPQPFSSFSQSYGPHAGLPTTAQPPVQAIPRAVSVNDQPTLAMFEQYGSDHNSSLEWLNSLHIPHNVEILQQGKAIWENGCPGCPPLKDWTVVMRNHKSPKGNNSSIYSQRKFIYNSKVFQRNNFDVDIIHSLYGELKPGKLYKSLNSTLPVTLDNQNSRFSSKIIEHSRIKGAKRRSSPEPHTPCGRVRRGKYNCRHSIQRFSSD